MQSDWKTHKLGELFELINGFAFKSSDFRPTGLPVIKIRNVKPNQIQVDDLAYVDSSFAIKQSNKIIRQGDILITMSGNRLGGSKETWVGKVAYFNLQRTFLLNQRVGILRPKNGVILNQKFCSYSLSSDEYQQLFISIATSSGGQANLSPAQIFGEELLLPPLKEQDAIAATLSALDDKIALLRETNVTLEAIAKALFKSWFVNFDPVRAKAEGREPEGVPPEMVGLFPSEFEESELGLVPMGWKAGNIGHIANVVDCLHSKKPELLVVGRPFLQLNNIRDDGLLDTSELACISEEDYKKWISRIEVSGGDCVITNVGRVGAVAQIPEGFKAATGRNMTAIRLRPEYHYPTYLIELLQSAWMRAEIESKTDSGTILNALNVKSIPLLRCVVASHAVMEVFESITRPLRASMEENIKRINTIASLRDTLLPRLMSGKLHIPDLGGITL